MTGHYQLLHQFDADIIGAHLSISPAPKLNRNRTGSDMALNIPHRQAAELIFAACNNGAIVFTSGAKNYHKARIYWF